MIYKTWHERERLQWYSRIATKREKEKERGRRRTKGVQIFRRGGQTGAIYVREGVERVVEKKREMQEEGRKEGEGLSHGGFITVMYHYVRLMPLTSYQLLPYISLSRYFIFIRRRNS